MRLSTIDQYCEPTIDRLFTRSIRDYTPGDPRKGGPYALDGNVLQVNINKVRAELGWDPPISLRDALRETADGFLRQKNCKSRYRTTIQF